MSSLSDTFRYEYYRNKSELADELMTLQSTFAVAVDKN